jgi:hypothetical protein
MEIISLLRSGGVGVCTRGCFHHAHTRRGEEIDREAWRGQAHGPPWDLQTATGLSGGACVMSASCTVGTIRAG